MLLVGVVGQFLILQPLQQAFPDLHRFREEVIVRPETHEVTELSLETDRLAATPVPRPL